MMVKITEKFKEFMENKKSEVEELAQRLEEEGIYQLGAFSMPRMILADDRVPLKAKMLYILLSSVAELNEPFQPNLDKIAEVLEVEREGVDRALDYLIMLGYFEVNEEDELIIVQFPQMDRSVFEKHLEKAEEFGSVLEGLEKLAQTMKEEGHDIPDLEEVLETFENNGWVKTTHQKIRVDKRENIKAQIFKQMAEEITENIPESAKSICVTIEFESGVAKVEIE